jgi:uncharacterized protein YdeI (YjbR/CyaY-like superfamily)
MAKPPSKAAPDPDLRLGDQTDWARWLQRHHDKSPGVWLVIAKKGSGLTTPTYPEALEVALCFGWIDGQKGPRDTTCWAQRFTPRGPRSIWSQINVAKAEALIAQGKMTAAGLRAIEAAKADGRWAAAYAPPSRAVVPPDLRAALDANRTASTFFATLNSSNRYAILFRIATAKKAETRHRRIAQLVQMLADQKKLH